MRFQELFHSPFGVLFQLSLTVLYAIGRLEYLALESGLPRFTRDFSCPALLRIQFGVGSMSLTGLSPSVAHLPRRFSYLTVL